MTFSTVLTVGGIGLSVALLEQVLEAMDKPNYATLLKMLAIGAFAFFALDMFTDLLKEMEAFITQWSL